MKIEIAHPFAATHEHMVPPGIMSKRHRHDWRWSVRLDGETHPVYGWVADFDEVRDRMAECTAGHYEGTAERILLGLVAALAPRLPPGVALVWAQLEEAPGRAAVWEP